MQLIDFNLDPTLEAMKNGKELCIVLAKSTIDGLMNKDFSKTSKTRIIVKSVCKKYFTDHCNFFKLEDQFFPLRFSMIFYKNNPLMKAINIRYNIFRTNFNEILEFCNSFLRCVISKREEKLQNLYIIGDDLIYFIVLTFMQFSR